MLNRIGVMMMAAVFATTIAAAQEKKVPDKPDAKAERVEPKTAPDFAGQPINVKIEVSITDQTGTGNPAKKVVSMIASDRNQNFVRSSASVPVRNVNNVTIMNYRNVTINVDARPTIVMKEPTKVHLVLGLEYLPKAAGNQEETEPGMAQLSERLALILESGKPMVVSQAADPASDRKITVEVTATILR
jgi:hypothetical protein